MRTMKRIFQIALLGLVSLGFPATSTGVEFASPVSYPVGLNPKAVVIADFNGDGKADIAVANMGSGNVSILLGNGDGTLKEAMNFQAGPSPQALAVGDFNGDQRLDLIVVYPGDPTNNNPGEVDLLLGNGDGRFRAPMQIHARQFPINVAMGDFNGDGRLDLAVVGVAYGGVKGGVTITLGDGDGTFQAPRDYSTESSARGVTIADFNGDGKADLALAGVFGGGAGILVGNGDGTFGLPVGSVSAGALGLSIAAGDFDGDTKLDLLVRLGHGTASSVGLLLGKGDGTFSQGSTLATGACHAGTPFAADFNGHRRLDLAVIAGGTMEYGVCVFLGGPVLVFAGHGDGTFQVPTIVGTAHGQNLGAAADLDGDELPDLVILNSDNTISVLLNSTAQDFSLNPAATNLTVKRGGQVSDVLTIGAQGGLSRAIALECSISGPSPMPTCSISPASATPSSNATLTVNAAALSASLTEPWFEQGASLHAAWLPLGLLGCVLATRFDKKRRRMWALSLLLVAVSILPVACGGGSGSPPPPVAQSYTVTVTATAGAIQHSANVTVTVQ